MKQFAFSFLLFIFSFLGAQSPSWQWAQSGTCTTTDNGSSLATDNSGNVFTTGYFFGSNFAFTSTTLINAGNYDAYISKHDNNGIFLWAQSIGGPFDEVSNSVACDNAGNVFVTGYYTSNTLTIGAFTLTNMGGTDVFVAKFDPNGNVMWAKSFGDNMIEEPYGITTDGSNVFVTGQFQSNLITFGTGTLTCNGGGDVFTAKYDNNGNELWAKGFGDTGLEIGYDISLSGTNDIYITGSFRSPVLTFSTYTLTNNGGSDYFVIRYDASGNELWAKGEGGNFDDAGTSIKYDLGSLYVTGQFKSTTINFGSATYTNASIASADIFVVNYNSSGNEVWSSAYGGNLDDIPYGIVCDPGGNVFIGGHIHSSSVAFGIYTLTCSGVGDAFVTKFNSAGTVTWAENQGGINDDGINDIAADQFYHVFATGFYNSASINFNSYTLNNNGSSDLFLAKLYTPPSGINGSMNDQPAISLYPNPASSDLTISNLQPNSTIKIFDLNGKELMRYSNQNTEFLNMETQTLAAGLYFASINSENSNQILKFIILH